jgi:hypothetical protein
LKAFKLIRRYPPTKDIDTLITGATFEDGTTVVQFVIPVKSLALFKSFKDFKKTYKRLFAKEQRTELVEVDV